MTDSVNVFPPFWRFLDANGDPVSGGYLEFYLAGSSTPLSVYSNATLISALGTTVYCDSGGHPVASSGSSTKVSIWTGTTDYKIVGKTSAGATLGTLDNFIGANDTSGYAVTSARPIGNVVAKALSTWSASTSDGSGTLYNANVSGGSQIATLPSAVTAENGYILGIRHDGKSSSNTVSYKTVSSQTIQNGNDSVTVTAGSIPNYGETVWLISDGAGWTIHAHVPPLIKSGIIVIADRLTAAPSSPTPGARYILNGTATGTWLTLGFDQHDILEADGQGGWIEYSPPTDAGWIAYVQDENIYTAFVGTAWSDQTGMTGAQSSILKCAIFEFQALNGVSGGSSTAGSSQMYPLSTFVNTGAANVITSAAIASSQITLPAGTYRIKAVAGFHNPNYVQIGFKSTTTITEIWGEVSYMDAASSPGVVQAHLCRDIVVASTEIFEMKYFLSGAQATTGLGLSSSFSNGVEIYGQLIVEDLTALQGATGAAGAQGNTGRDAGLGRWTFSIDTASSDPNSGVVKFNSGTIGSVTEVYISETDADTTASAAILAALDDSTSTTKGLLQFRKNGTPGTVVTFSISGAITDNGSWVTIPVTYVNGALPSASDSLLPTFGPKGDIGSTGTAGATGSVGATGTTGATGPNTGLDYSWNTATSGDPGTGKLLVNHATPASATVLHISETNRLSASQATYIATWDDGTTTGDKGVVRIVDLAAPGTNFLEYQITTTLTDVGTYDTFPVTYLGGAGTIVNATTVAVMFFKTGNKGTDGAGTGDVVGPASATNNSLARYDGTTGKLLKNGAVIGTDVQAYDADLAALAGLTSAADKGIQFTGSGTAATFDLTTAGRALLDDASAAAQATTLGLGTGDNPQFTAVNIGHATDTTLGRLAAGVPTIEGNAINVRAYTTTATAVGTTTLTVSSTSIQYFTGTTTQTVVLPVTSTLATGMIFNVVNNSTGDVTVQSSGLNNILVMGPGSEANFVCILITGTTAASWDAKVRYQNVPIISKSAAYTTVLSDSGKCIFHPSADTTARTFTIDSNANVAYPVGTVITFVNQISAGVVTISITSDTMYLAGTGTTGSRSLAAHGIATALKMTTTTWIISGTGLT